MRKILDTLKICTTLAMARTFGRYEHSGFNGSHEYAKYRWRGQSWCIPTQPCEPST